MSDAELYATWYMWLGVAAGVVVIAAGLLLAIWMYARRILRLAVAALGLVKEIRANTMSIWTLEETNQVAVKILERAQAIHEHGGAVAEALHAADSEEVR